MVHASTLTPTPTPTPTPEQENQLVKKHSEAKRTAEAERESQAQQVATAQANPNPSPNSNPNPSPNPHQVATAQGKLSKKESEVFGKSEEVNRQKAEQEEKEDEVRKGDPVWLTPGFDFAARAAEADREVDEARKAGEGSDAFLATFMTDVVDNATAKGQCGVCRQECGEVQIEHMRKKQKRYQDKSSVRPEERHEKIRQKSELVREAIVSRAIVSRAIVSRAIVSIAIVSIAGGRAGARPMLECTALQSYVTEAAALGVPCSLQPYDV